MAGWEGIAHDSRVLTETLRDQDTNRFPIPPEGMYYLCDAAYTHTRGFMCPYKSTRYWLKDFDKGGPARNKEEMFNHAHSQLRNVIERTFGVLKARFPILKRMPSYSYRTQVHLVVACMAIHNFIRSVSLSDELFRRYENENLVIPVEVETHSEGAEAPPRFDQIFSPASQAQMVNLRNQIAEQLWNLNH